jgi:hypothetical protein
LWLAGVEFNQKPLVHVVCSFDSGIISIMKAVLLIFLFTLLNAAQAQSIYKLVDENGNVSYSSQAPEEPGDAEILAAPPEPTAEEVEAARQRQKELERDLKERAEKREKAEQQRQETQAAQQVNTVVQTQVMPVPVYTNRRVARPRNLPVRRPMNRPR